MAIDLNKSQRGKDFGCGFYLSETEAQAEKMAKFKVQLFGGQSIVQSYEFDEVHLSEGSLRYLRFDGLCTCQAICVGDNHWVALLFLEECRVLS